MVPQSMKETTAFLLARVCKSHRRRIHRRLEELGLYRGQQFVLFALWEREGLSHSELARQVHVRPATVTNAIKRMERAGFVERRPDPEDERVSRVYLTEAGRDVREAVEGIWRELAAQTLAGFSLEEREQLHSLLQRVVENLNPEGE
jgi:DNA-binding MarR family transcriptional regulator